MSNTYSFDLLKSNKRQTRNGKNILIERNVHLALLSVNFCCRANTSKNHAKCCWVDYRKNLPYLSRIRATDTAVLFAITLIDNKCSSRCHPGESSAHLSRIFVSGTGGNKFLLLCFNFDGQTGRQALISQWIPSVSISEHQLFHSPPRTESQVEFHEHQRLVHVKVSS